MKNSILLTISVLIGNFSIAQNTKPLVSITNVAVDEVAEKVVITYNLSDVNNDNCDVWLKVSRDDGEFFELISATDLTGQVGENTAPGNGKVLEWNYQSISGNIYDTKLRLFASNSQSIGIQQMVDQVDETKLFQTLQYIEGVRHFSSGAVHLNRVRDSIQTIFNRFGLHTETHQFTFSNQTGINILGRKQGLKDEAITFIVDAHYDGVFNSPAADDNGTGVAGMLEILRILSQYDFEHSIRFIGFDFEESGLIGSQRYVQNGIKPYEDIQGVLNFEMIGYYTDEPNTQTLPNGFELLFPTQVQTIADNEFRGDFLVVCGNVNSQSLVTSFVNASSTYVPDLKLINLVVPGNGLIAPDLRRSDHAPFWDAGKKALMLTDGADTRNFNYHTPGDTIGTLNFDFMQKVVKATLATVAELAKPISAGFDEFDLGPLSVHNHDHKFPAIVELLPNPSNGQLFLKINAHKKIRIKMQIFDLSGKVVWSDLSNFPFGESTYTLNINELKSGNYILLLSDGENTLSKSLVLNK